MSTKIIIHEIKQMGFWVEIEEKAFVFLVMRHFLAADGSLGSRSMIHPDMVVADGLFKDKSAARLAANQYAGIKARIDGKWSITIQGQDK